MLFLNNIEIDKFLAIIKIGGQKILLYFVNRGFLCPYFKNRERHWSFGEILALESRNIIILVNYLESVEPSTPNIRQEPGNPSEKKVSNEVDNPVLRLPIGYAPDELLQTF